MCTLLLANQLWDSEPGVIAANRDEFLDRASSGPQYRTAPPPARWAPQDEVAGGTWLGVNPAGLFVGITNRFGKPPNRASRSRGHLVLDALAQPTAEQAAAAIGAYDPSVYNGFHLLLVARHSAWCIVHRGDVLDVRPLDTGVHIITERGFGAADSPREAVIHRMVSDWPRQPHPPTDGALQTLLRRHGEDPWGSTCVHAPDMNYGTRSSSILRLDGASGDWHYQHAMGAPCTAEWSLVPVRWPGSIRP